MADRTFDLTRGRFRLARGTNGAILLTLKGSDDLVLHVKDMREARDLEELFTRFVDHVADEEKAARWAGAAPSLNLQTLTVVSDDPCPHATVMPTFDAAAARGLDANEVRRRWPRFFGECPDCHVSLILYASREHYYSGDW